MSTIEPRLSASQVQGDGVVSLQAKFIIIVYVDWFVYSLFVQYFAVPVILEDILAF